MRTFILFLILASVTNAATRMRLSMPISGPSVDLESRGFSFVECSPITTAPADSDSDDDGSVVLQRQVETDVRDYNRTVIKAAAVALGCSLPRGLIVSPQKTIIGLAVKAMKCGDYITFVQLMDEFLCIRGRISKNWDPSELILVHDTSTKTTLGQLLNKSGADCERPLAEALAEIITLPNEENQITALQEAIQKYPREARRLAEWAAGKGSLNGNYSYYMMLVGECVVQVMDIDNLTLQTLHLAIRNGHVLNVCPLLNLIQNSEFRTEAVIECAWRLGHLGCVQEFLNAVKLMPDMLQGQFLVEALGMHARQQRDAVTSLVYYMCKPFSNSRTPWARVIAEGWLDKTTSTILEMLKRPLSSDQKIEMLVALASSDADEIWEYIQRVMENSVNFCLRIFEFLLWSYTGPDDDYILKRLGAIIKSPVWLTFSTEEDQSRKDELAASLQAIPQLLAFDGGCDLPIFSGDHELVALRRVVYKLFIKICLASHHLDWASALIQESIRVWDSSEANTRILAITMACEMGDWQSIQYLLNECPGESIPSSILLSQMYEPMICRGYISEVHKMMDLVAKSAPHAYELALLQLMQVRGGSRCGEYAYEYMQVLHFPVTDDIRGQLLVATVNAICHSNKWDLLEQIPDENVYLHGQMWTMPTLITVVALMTLNRPTLRYAFDRGVLGDTNPIVVCDLAVVLEGINPRDKAMAHLIDHAGHSMSGQQLFKLAGRLDISAELLCRLPMNVVLDAVEYGLDMPRVNKSTHSIGQILICGTVAMTGEERERLHGMANCLAERLPLATLPFHEEKCAICLEALNDEEVEVPINVYQAPCGDKRHILHRHCLGSMLFAGCFCPLCRREFPEDQTEAADHGL